MAFRTTPAAVRLIIETDDDAIPDLDPFIEIANALVTECCADVETYDATRLELIERWLSAHFYAIRDPRAASERAGKVGQSNQYKVDLVLFVTTYGQQALALDTAGGLAALNKKTKDGTARTPGFAWLGTDYNEDEDDE